MARLIDADALPYENQVLSYDDEWCLKVSDIENAPTVDAVEVVWCKDCNYWECGKDYEPYCNLFGNMMTDTKPYDFCSYGERKDNG